MNLSWSRVALGLVLLGSLNGLGPPVVAQAAAVEGGGHAALVRSRAASHFEMVDAMLMSLSRSSMRELERMLRGVEFTPDAITPNAWRFEDDAAELFVHLVIQDEKVVFGGLTYSPRDRRAISPQSLDQLARTHTPRGLDGPDRLIFERSWVDDPPGPSTELKLTETVVVGLVDGAWLSTKRTYRLP